MILNPEELRDANERVLEGEERIAEQQERIAQLERDGSDTAAAREMLVILENSQSLLVARRDLLMRQK